MLGLNDRMNWISFEQIPKSSQHAITENQCKLLSLWEIPAGKYI